METKQTAIPNPSARDNTMSEQSIYLEDLETPQRELEDKIEIFLKRAGMGGDPRELREQAKGLGDLKHKMNLLEEKIEELRQAEGPWKDLTEGVEKAYPSSIRNASMSHPPFLAPAW